MFQVFISEHFKRQVKGPCKKHPFLIEDIIVTLKQFDAGKATSLGANTYKIRISSRTFRKGKRGAFRMIVLIISVDSILTPLSLYAKADQETISRQEILYHIAMVKLEL